MAGLLKKRLQMYKTHNSSQQYNIIGNKKIIIIVQHLCVSIGRETSFHELVPRYATALFWLAFLFPICSHSERKQSTK